MKAIKRLIQLLILLAIVLPVLAISLLFLIDLNEYKPQIIAQAEQATGRDVRIDGELSHSIWPLFGFSIGAVALGNADGFSNREFAAIEQLDVGIKLLPLLKQEVEVNVVRLHGLKVSLEADAGGNNNWSGIGASASDAGSDTAGASRRDAGENGASSRAKKQDTTGPTEKQADTSTGAASFDLKSLRVDGIEFIGAEIRYDDAATGMQSVISELNLETGAITFDEFIDLSFSTRIQNNQPEADARITLTARLKFDSAFSVIELADMKLAVQADTEFLPREETIELASQVMVRMQDQTIRLSDLQLDALGTVTRSDLSISRFQVQPKISGDITVEPFNARKVARRAGAGLPDMAGKKALSNVGMNLALLMQGDKLEVNNIVVALDDSTLSGWLHVDSIASQQLRYDLEMDSINLNHYMPPATEGAPKKAGKAAGGASTADKTSGDKAIGDKTGKNAGKNVAQGAAQDAELDAALGEPTGNETIELPMDMIRALDVTGNFRIGQLKALDYDISEFHLGTIAKDGIITLKPVAMKLLEGSVDAVVTLDARKDSPRYGIELDVARVQAGPVVDPFLAGLQGDNDITVAGAINLDMNVNTRGDTLNKLKRNSKGTIKLAMQETQVGNFDPAYYMRRSVAETLDESGFGLSSTIMGDFKPREVTVFDSITSTIKLADGKATTRNFLMDSKRVDIGASGHVDIMANTTDMTASISLPRGKTSLEKVLDEPMYVRVHGPFAALEYAIDTDRLRKSTTGALEADVKDKVDRQKRKAQREAERKAKRELQKQEDKLKDDIKDKLDDELKGLFR